MYFGFYCIILYFTQRIEFAVFIKSVCFGTLISVENSHFNEYSVNSTDKDDRPIGHLPQKPTCGIMTSESKAGGHMGCAMTNCNLAQCIRSRKPDCTITTTITGGTHSTLDNGRYFYFSSLYIARVLNGAADEKSSRRPGAAMEHP